MAYISQKKNSTPPEIVNPDLFQKGWAPIEMQTLLDDIHVLYTTGAGERIVFVESYLPSINKEEFDKEKSDELSWLYKLAMKSSFSRKELVCVKPNIKSVTGPVNGPCKPGIRRGPCVLEEDILESIIYAIELPDHNGKSPEKVTLIGSSTGGYAALLYAAMFPERVSKLILIAPWIGGEYARWCDVISGPDFINPAHNRRAVENELEKVEYLFTKEKESLENKISQISSMTYSTEKDKIEIADLKKQIEALNYKYDVPFVFGSKTGKQVFALPYAVYNEGKKSILPVAKCVQAPTTIFAHSYDDRVIVDGYYSLGQTIPAKTCIYEIEKTTNMLAGTEVRENVSRRIDLIITNSPIVTPNGVTRISSPETDEKYAKAVQMQQRIKQTLVENEITHHSLKWKNIRKGEDACETAGK
jgi:hypothetical protein